MKSHSILTAALLPFLVTSSPAPEPEAKAEPLPAPQIQYLIPLLGALATGGVILGTLGSVANGAKGAAGSAQACRCSNLPKCTGTQCECANENKIACWVQQRGKCKIEIQACTANARNKNNGLPTPLGSPYPPCGRGLPDCANKYYCKKLDTNCAAVFNDGGCLGICVPTFAEVPAGQQTSKDNKGQTPWWAKGAKQPAPQPKQQAPPPPPPRPQGDAPPAPGLCPQNFRCPDGLACVADPRSGNRSYMCVTPNEICGGWRNDTCYNGKICVRDPRLQCDGQGCTGICV